MGRGEVGGGKRGRSEEKGEERKEEVNLPLRNKQFKTSVLQ